MRKLTRRRFLVLVSGAVAAVTLGHHRPNHKGGPPHTREPEPTPTATPVPVVYSDWSEYVKVTTSSPPVDSGHVWFSSWSMSSAM